MILRTKDVENIVGKGEAVFSIQEQMHLHHTLNMDESKILLCGKGLTLYQTTTYLEQSKFKAFAEDNLNVDKLAKFIVLWIGKGKSADYQHFLLFPQCFLKYF